MGELFLWDRHRCLNQELSEGSGEKNSSPEAGTWHLGQLPALNRSFNYGEGAKMQQEAYLPTVGNNDIVYYIRLKTLHSGLFQFLFTMLKKGLNIGCETCQPPLETLLESIDNLNVHERTCLKPVYFKYSTSQVFKGCFCSKFPFVPAKYICRTISNISPVLTCCFTGCRVPA